MIKRADGRWQDQIKLPGMAKPKYFYGKTQKDVKRKMAEWTKDQTAGKSFGFCADAWIKSHREHIAYNTIRSYDAALERTKEHFAERLIQEIGPDEIDAFVRWIGGRGYAKSTVQVHLQIINMVFNFAIVHRWATYNPCPAVKVTCGAPKKKRKLPTDEQLQKIRDGVNLPFGLFPFMLLHTGMRRGELLALRWEDIDREKKVIHVRRALYHMSNEPQIKAPKTEAGYRDIILLDPLEKVLPEPGEGYIFGGEKPLKKSVFVENWRKWCKQAGLSTAVETERYRCESNNREYVKHERSYDITPHQLRHAFATILFDAGIDIKDAQDLLGHASIQVTRDIYTHIRQQRREKTAEKLNEFFACQDYVKSDESADI